MLGWMSSLTALMDAEARLAIRRLWCVLKWSSKEEDIRDLSRKLFKRKPPMTPAQASRYQIAIDLDGISQSGSNVPFMAMGSAVLRSSIFRDFAHEWIAPWVQ